MQRIDSGVSEAVKTFWQTREQQRRKQGSSTGKKDYGLRGSVTGGKQLDGFITLLTKYLEEWGLPKEAIHFKRTVLPGYYRPTKEWDIVVVVEKQLIASIELKSHIGPSFGNNFNNRVEEALGSASDIWAAYREGAFKPSSKPWVGYLLLLEKHAKSLKSVVNREPHFHTFPEFNQASYMRRYEIFCQKLIRERIYDAACFLISEKESGLQGKYEEPSPENDIRTFLSSLRGKVTETVLKFNL